MGCPSVSFTLLKWSRSRHSTARHLAALDALELVLEAFAQQHAIGQVGERVVARHVRDLLFGAPTLGDVFVGGEPSAGGERLVHDREDAAVGQVEDVVECRPRRCRPSALRCSRSGRRRNAWTAMR